MQENNFVNKITGRGEKPISKMPGFHPPDDEEHEYILKKIQKNLKKETVSSGSWMIVGIIIVIMYIRMYFKSTSDDKGYILMAAGVFGVMALICAYRLFFVDKQISNIVKEKKYQIVSDQVFKKISDTVTPQGIVAVVKQKSYSIDYIIEKRNKEKSCIVVLDRLQDPGNMGTIVRTGEAAGISGIIMSKDSADIYNPKVIRSTMGSIFRVPFAIVDDLAAAVDTLKDNGITTYAAHLKGELYNSGSLTKDCALLIGNEARGLSEEISAKADKLIKIPMHGKVESLNAAIATAILMYEAAR